jgi:hypothetical protein
VSVSGFLGEKNLPLGKQKKSPLLF